ncbi:MAG: hypothetical protein ACI9IA_002033 [Enterobacterales bacterium]|jgi:hypothetical protein
MRIISLFKLLMSTLLLFSMAIFKAATPIYEISIKDHLFYPSSFEIPAGIKVKLVIYNNDSTPEEFESYELNREKIIMGNRKAIVFIGPLTAGKYPFFGEFNIKTAQGIITVVESDK